MVSLRRVHLDEVYLGDDTRGASIDCHVRPKHLVTCRRVVLLGPPELWLSHRCGHSVGLSAAAVAACLLVRYLLLGCCSVTLRAGGTVVEGRRRLTLYTGVRW